MILHPTPLPADNEYIKKLKQAIPPDNTTAKEASQHTMGFSYHQVMGEVIWPMVKCCPDISPAVVKLSQYLENPAEEHYIAAKHLASIYIANTIEGKLHPYTPITTQSNATPRPSLMQ
jgi:hypothetical protein